MQHTNKSRSFLSWIVAAAATAATLPDSAYACMMFVPPKLEDVSHADVVVIGRIENYRIIRDEAFRKEMLASPSLPEEMRNYYKDPKQGLLSDYARFDLRVEEVLVGNAPVKLSVTWDNSTFAEPEQIASGRYLIALRWPSSAALPLRGPSATILPTPDPNALTVLQAPCSRAFLYPVGSEEARAIREILKTQDN